MKITKYAHACLILDNGHGKVVIDAGNYTVLPKDLSDVRLIIITDAHFDHFGLDNLKQLLAQNPTASVYSTAEVASQLQAAQLDCQVVSDQQIVDPDGYNIKLVKADHAPVYKVSPGAILTVQVGSTLYYPSDSFTPPTGQVAVLALPISGPWFKLSQALDLANNNQSSKLLATHDIMNSPAGNQVLANSIHHNLANQQQLYVQLEDGQSIDV